MRIILLSSISIISFLFTDAQGYIQTDLSTGRPYKVVKSEDIQGSEFLYEDWKPAEVTFTNGIKVKDLPVKFDSYQNRFFYLQNDSVFEFVMPIREVVFFPNEKDSVSKMVIRRELSGVKWPGFAKFCHILSSGKYSLIKFYSKSLSETYEYGTNRSIKQLKSESQLYLITPDEAIPIKNIRKESEKVFGNQWALIQSYLQTQKISLKSERDLVEVVRHLNSL